MSLSTQDHSTQLTPTPVLAADALEASTIMVIDDESINIRITHKHLAKAGYEKLRGETDPMAAILQLQNEPVDLVLLDVAMPNLGGLELLHLLKKDPRTERIAVLMLTASDDESVRNSSVEFGATDFLRKPVDPHELVLRVSNTLRAKRYEDSLLQEKKDLQSQVRKRTEQIQATRMEVVHCLARAAEFRDNETGHHIQRVGQYAGVIAEELGLDADEVELIEVAAPLHDVGKIGVPDAILLKPGKLSDEEFEIMRKHTSMGGRVFEKLSQPESQTLRNHVDIGGKIFGDPRFELLRLAKVIALTHHEKYDGSGYPLGLAGEDIPLAGRIVAVADVYDALSSVRPYKEAIPRERCFEIMEQGRGEHFDPVVLDAFFRRASDIVNIQIDLADLY